MIVRSAGSTTATRARRNGGILCLLEWRMAGLCQVGRSAVHKLYAVLELENRNDLG